MEESSIPPASTPPKKKNILNNTSEDKGLWFATQMQLQIHFAVVNRLHMNLHRICCWQSLTNSNTACSAHQKKNQFLFRQAYPNVCMIYISKYAWSCIKMPKMSHNSNKNLWRRQSWKGRLAILLVFSSAKDSRPFKKHVQKCSDRSSMCCPSSSNGSNGIWYSQRWKLSAKNTFAVTMSSYCLCSSDAWHFGCTLHLSKASVKW